MRNDAWFAISCLVAVGHLAACAIDDSMVPADAGNMAASTTGGGKSAGTSSVAAAGGRAGSTGASGSGTGGTTGTGGAGGTEAGADVAIESSTPEACAPESEAALCARVHKNCGSFVGQDNCGVSRAVLACGRCLDDGAACGSAGTLNVCPGSEPVNRAQGGTVLSTNPMSPPMGAAEGDTKAFDGDIQTKWYVRGNPTPSIAYDFGGSRAYVITSYTITSANDQPDRDPLTWRLEGSNSPNLSMWTPLDTRTNETFAARGQTNYYEFANTKAYVVYRFTVIFNNGNTLNGGEFQVAEIQLFGNPATPADAGIEAATPDAMTDASDGAHDGAHDAAADVSSD
jgi:hypothetical protein